MSADEFPRRTGPSIDELLMESCRLHSQAAGLVQQAAELSRHLEALRRKQSLIDGRLRALDDSIRQRSATPVD